MCLNIPVLLILWLFCQLLQCNALGNVSYKSVSLVSLCPQLRPDAYLYTENDVNVQLPVWEPKTLNLGMGVGSATLLNERLNNSIFQRPLPPPAIDCYFDVTTGPESEGIFVVLSQLSALRRWSNGSCQDYLKINYANFYSAAICAPVGIGDSSIVSFDSSIGVVKVQLHLDNTPGDRVQEFQLRMKLVLTSYFDCAKYRGGFSCTGTNERCIPVEYAGDGIINCDVPSCRDEGSCVNRPDVDDAKLEQMYRESVSITILIGLVSFVTTGLMFGLFLWFCLKRNFKQRLNTTASTPNLDMELSDVYGTPQAGGGRQRNLEATAGSSGMDQNGGPSPSADPPPSYDILFPDK